MKKFLMLAAVVVLVAAVLALPALAQGLRDNNVRDNLDNNDVSRFGVPFSSFFNDLSNQDLRRLDRLFNDFNDNNDHNNDFNDHRFDNNFNFNNNTGVNQEFDQQIGDTGNVSLNTTVTNSGDNGNQCVAPLQFGNTGNAQNAQGFLQYNSTADDIEFEGSSMIFAPSLTNTCDQSVKQAAAAG